MSVVGARLVARQVVWPAPGHTALEEVELNPPVDDQVLVATVHSAVSPGTERARLTNVGGDVDYPYRPGYSLAGRVLAVGPRVTAVAPDDLVCVWGPHASHVLVPQSRVVVCPGDVDLADAAFFHLAFVALLGVRRARIELGEPVAVIGQGLLGLLTTQLARLQGAAPLVAVDLDDERLARARMFGADRVISSADEAACLEEVRAWTDGGPPVVIEVTGLPPVVDLATRMVRRLGRVALLGHQWSHDSPPADQLLRIHNRGITLLGVQTLARPQLESRPGAWTWQDDTRAYLQLLRLGRIDVRSLVTHRATIGEVTALYDHLAAGDAGIIGALIDW